MKARRRCLHLVNKEQGLPCTVSDAGIKARTQHAASFDLKELPVLWEWRQQVNKQI